MSFMDVAPKTMSQENTCRLDLSPSSSDQNAFILDPTEIKFENASNYEHKSLVFYLPPLTKMTSYLIQQKSSLKMLVITNINP